VATTLFNNALGIGEIGAVLTRYGYDEPTLRRGRDLNLAYQRAMEAQALAKSAAKQATRAQWEALVELQQWIVGYMKIARVALRGQPELLKELKTARQNGRAAAAGTAKTRRAPEPAATPGS
jgi:hypothetical protein